MSSATESRPSPAPPGPPCKSQSCVCAPAALPRTRLTKNVALGPSGLDQSSGTSTFAHSARPSSPPVTSEHFSNAIDEASPPAPPSDGGAPGASGGGGDASPAAPHEAAPNAPTAD